MNGSKSKVKENDLSSCGDPNCNKAMIPTCQHHLLQGSGTEREAHDSRIGVQSRHDRQRRERPYADASSAMTSSQGDGPILLGTFLALPEQQKNLAEQKSR